MDLKEEVAKFRKWAIKNPGRYGEWEVNYEDWDALYKTFFKFIENSSAEALSPKEIEDLIYVIGRDNEDERLIEFLTKQEEIFLVLAFSAITADDIDARWQFAHYLGEFKNMKEDAEKLLLKYFKDPNEYVSRRALMALANMGSSYTEEYCEKAWESDLEYQRIAVLYSLNKINSKQLESHLSKAMDDGRQSLVKNAEKYRKEIG